MEATLTIDFYPGDLAIEDAEAVFEVDKIDPDPSVGVFGGYWATLAHVPFGGISLTREQMIGAIGVRALCAIEETVSERITNDPQTHISEPETA